VTAIIGKKIGMTQVFAEDGTLVPVTVIEAPPCHVTAVRDPERDGYAALQLGADEVDESALTKGELGHAKKAGVPPVRELVEFRGEGDRQVGETVTVEQFEPGTRVKVSATAIGKGFQGTIRRHNFSRGPVTHGSHNVRAPGSIGASADPARVFKGMRMPGRMGGRRATQRRLEVVEVDAERNLLLLKGAVPGPKGGRVEVRGDD
jgi:large subunit ribosomal protein L3